MGSRRFSFRLFGLHEKLISVSLNFGLLVLLVLAIYHLIPAEITIASLLLFFSLVLIIFLSSQRSAPINMASPVDQSSGAILRRKLLRVVGNSRNVLYTHCWACVMVSSMFLALSVSFPAARVFFLVLLLGSIPAFIRMLIVSGVEAYQIVVQRQ
jgi:hypothetical protein